MDNKNSETSATMQFAHIEIPVFVAMYRINRCRNILDADGTSLEGMLQDLKDRVNGEKVKEYGN